MHFRSETVIWHWHRRGEVEDVPRLNYPPTRVVAFRVVAFRVENLDVIHHHQPRHNAAASRLVQAAAQGRTRCPAMTRRR